MSAPAVLAASQASLQKHARTFAWAAALLGRQLQQDVAITYAFCRYLDDLADESPDPAQAETALNSVRRDLQRRESAAPLVAAMLALVQRRQIDLRALLALVDGVQSDLGEVQVRSQAEFDRYCYQVAGAVGVLMCGLFGVRDTRALPYAIDLGLAMQRTNICRDVAEDATMGRTYLPAVQLLKAGVAPGDLLVARQTPRGVLPVIEQVLHDADVLYHSARQGYRFLPLQPRLAVAVAGQLYSMIGDRLRRQGGDPWRGRAMVPAWQKVLGTLWAVGVALLAPLWRGAHNPSLHQHLQGFAGADASAATAGQVAARSPADAHTALR